jgi:serine/threonine protein kinase
MNLTPKGGEDPKVFHDFENHGMIGSGAFSDVYKVRNPDDGKFYAVKRSKNRIKNKSDRLRYLQEPKMFKRLGTSTSSNVLQYYSAWQEEGYFYTLTELCSGGNLKNLLEQLDDPPVLPEEAIWYVVKQVATGLDQLHTKGLVHMDIKPDNILISDTGVLKLGDLGMARPVNCSEDGLEGDAVYMAPELLTSPVKTRQLDLFSFGVMIWELASGRFPPRDGSRWKKFREGQAEDPPQNLRRSKRLCRLIRSLMHPQPRYRPNSEEVLQEAAQALSRIGRKGAAASTAAMEGKKEASGGGEFILRTIQRQALLRDDQAKKRRRTMSDEPTGITSSSSFQRIAGSGGSGSSGGLRLSIPQNGFDPNRLQQERMGMCTPTEQIVGLSYGMGTPGMATPSFSRK